MTHIKNTDLQHFGQQVFISSHFCWKKKHNFWLHGGGGKLVQILGRYVPQQNQKYTHNPGKIFHWKTTKNL